MNPATATLWPALPLDAWEDTRATLHMWSQIVGKVRLAQTPLVNHWWNVPLYVSARGLTTSAMPYGETTFEMEFDFIDHNLVVKCSDGAERRVKLEPKSVATFYQETMAALSNLGLQVHIWTMPVEIPDPIRFEEDQKHASYDPDYVRKFWRVLRSSTDVLQEFRARFIGKCSPVHFFWGSFDLAVTRFSGRPAPPRPDADPITREAYSHEVISHGFWPGHGFGKPAFYSYTAPAPNGLSEGPLRPKEAYYSKDLNEFLLLYDDVRQSTDPEKALMEFCESTYEAGANLAGWDRAALER
ncbi:MAG: hypothetical protein C5B55_12565 [Blastocatellia bacterium]|nr:MAG: hypothetical protein C5B55_12565 [Blastocatellia bacterium]